MASYSSSYYDYGGSRYRLIEPIYGVVSNSSPDYRVELGSFALYDVRVLIRHFYTNGTPVHLAASSNEHTTRVWDFHNTTSEPIQETFWFDYPTSLSLTIEFAGNTTLFSGWVLVLGLPLPVPIPPPPYPWSYVVLPSIIGIVILGVGLYLFWVQKQVYRSRNWDQALVFCALGFLLLSLSFPSVVAPHYSPYYLAPEYTNYGEFSGTVTQTEPHVNFTFHGLSQSELGIHGFHVTTSSVTVRVYSLDGSVNHTWNFVNSQYPGHQTFVIDAVGETVVEVIREAEDTAFRCWLQISIRPVELRQSYAGAYVLFATFFLVSGMIFLSLGSYFLVKGFRKVPKR